VFGVDTAAVGRHEGVVTVDSDGGWATIRVTATVDPQPTPAPQPRSVAVTQPPPTGQSTGGRVQQPPSRPPAPPAHATSGRPEPPGLARGLRYYEPPSPKYYQGDRLATWGQRFGAGIIDFLALIPGVTLILLVPPFPAWLAWIGLAWILVIKIYNRWYLQGRTGQSWGKRAVHLKLILMADKQPIGVAGAFLRGLAHLLDILTLGVGFLFPLWDVRRQTLADKVMTSIVISQDKTGSRIPRTPETGTSAQDSGDSSKQAS
jgi:uncharacterized RDD family membrane protein YckC